MDKKTIKAYKNGKKCIENNEGDIAFVLDEETKYYPVNSITQVIVPYRNCEHAE